MESTLLGQVWKKLVEALSLEKRIEPAHDPADRREKDAFSVTVDGITIRGRMFFPAAVPAKLYPPLVICHGIPAAGTPRPAHDPGYEKLAEDFAALGFASVFFNFRGCGDSGGDFDMAGWSRDLEGVMDRVMNTPHMDPTRLMVLGFSGGGAAAIRAAAEGGNVYALAVVGTPAHFEIFRKDAAEIIDDFRERGIIRSPDFPANPEQWLARFTESEPRRWIRQFQGKHLLIVHGDEDETVPFEHADELFTNAPAGITEKFDIPGGVHRLRLDERCVSKLKSWFTGCV